MPVVELEDLLRAGVHYGHPPSRWNPRTRAFIFDRRPNAYIIDLRKTVQQLVRARAFLRELAEGGGEFLLVGTKRQASNVVKTIAVEHSLHYVSDRWLGGTLTNFETIHRQLERLREVEEQESSGAVEELSKKERARFYRNKRKLLRNLEGIRNMSRPPDALIVVDPRKEKTAVHEAKIMSIPTIGIVDTDCDPDTVTIAIPANDDSMRSISLILEKLVQAIEEGRKALQPIQEPIPKAQSEGQSAGETTASEPVEEA